MEELDDKAYNKEVKVKGIDTTEGAMPNIEPEDPPVKKGKTPKATKTEEPASSFVKKDLEFPKAFEFKKPETQEESFFKGVSASGVGSATIKGDAGMFNYDEYVAATAPINLAEYIPNGNQREKFIEQHGEKLVQLSPGIFGIKFQNDVEDAIKFKENNHHIYMKNFLDELSASQGVMEKSALGFTNLVGGTLIHGTGLLPVIYGIGSAMWNLDSSKIFDNAAFDLWEGWSEGLNKYTAVYANSDVYDYNKETGEFTQKDFFARFAADPLAGISNDIIPTTTFITGMVVSELAAGALAPFTGGSSLVANTARLGAQSLKMVNKINKSKSIFSKTMKTLRGIDKPADDLLDMATRSSLNRTTEAFKQGMGLAVNGVRSASYESALIGRSIQDSTLGEILKQYHIDKGGEVDKDGDPVGELIKPTEAELESFKNYAKDAGVVGFWANIPLVAGSNFIQFSRLLQRGYKVSKTGTKIGTSVWDKYKFKGTRIVNGKRIANVDSSKYFQALGYTGAFLKAPITEAWEEFAQGAMEEGLVDYYASTYNKQAAYNYFDLLASITEKGKSYLYTTEGRDSVTLGALMGMLGVRVPGMAKNKAGKLRPTFKAYGGSVEAIRELNKDKKVARELAQKSLSTVNNDIMINNLSNTVRQMSTQTNMDEAALVGDVNEFKNQEHQQLFSLASRHYANGTQDVLLQDLKDLEALPLDEFNKLYNLEGDKKFTKEEKDATVKKALRDVESMIESISEVEAIIEENPEYGVDEIGKEIRKVLRGKNEYIQNSVGKVLSDSDPLTSEELKIANEIKEQLAYLNHTVVNSKNRESELKNKIGELSKNSFPIGALEQMETTPKGIKINTDTTDGLKLDAEVEFSDSIDNVVKATMEQWKRSDINSYNLHSKKVEKLVEDVARLKLREARAAALYNGLFTRKGAKLFREFAIELNTKRNEAIWEYAQKQYAEQAETVKSAVQASSIRNNAESIGDAGKEALQILDSKVQEGLEQYKNLDRKKLGPVEFEKEVMKLLAENPALFAEVKDYAIEELGEVITARNVEELDIVDTDGTETVGLLKAIEELSTRFKSSVPKASKRIFDDVTLNNAPGLNTREAIEQAIDEDSQKFFNDLETTVSNDDYIFINVNDKELDFSKGKPKPKLDTQTGRPIDSSIKEELKLDTSKLNAADFLDNATIKRNNVVFHLRVSETSEYNQEEGRTPYDMAVEVYYIEPGTNKQITVGQLPAFKEGGSAGLKLLREQVFTRFRRKKFFGNANSVKDYKKRKEEVIKELQELQKTKTNLSQLKTKETQRVVSEILANKAFIKGITKDGEVVELDSGIEYDMYYNTKTKKSFKRVTSFLFEPLESNEWLTSANKIGTATDKLVRDILSGTINQNSNDSDLEKYNLSDVDTVRQFINQITEFKKELEERGETILANDIVLYNEKLGVAGTVDVLTYTSDGKFKIYDMKTMRGNHVTQTQNLYDEKGNIVEEGVSKYDAKSTYSEEFGVAIKDDSKDSRREKHQKQLSLYRILLANTHGVIATELEVIPIVVNYEKGETTTTELSLQENIEVVPLDKVSDKDAEVNAELAALEDTTKTKEGLTEIEKEILEQYKVQLAEETERVNRGEGNPEIEMDLKEKIAELEKKSIQLKDVTFEDDGRPVPTYETESTVEIDAAISELKAELENLNINIKGAAPSFKYTQKIQDENFGDFVSEYTTYKRRKNPKVREQLIEKFGEDKVARYEAIDNSFDSIVEQITQSGINIFFDPETKTHKNC